MIKTILITGGAGFSASHLIEKLIKKKFNIVILEKTLDNIWRLNNLINKLTLYDSSTKISTIFKKNNIDCIIHLATYYYNKDVKSPDIQKLIETNILFPISIINEMINYGVKYFISTGSIFEFAIKDHYDFTEDSKKEAHDLYAASKTFFNDILKDYSKKNKIKVIDLKPSAFYGPRDNDNRLIITVIKHLINNKVFEISKGDQKWNWTYVKDIADAYMQSINYVQMMENNYESFNIGSDQVVSIKEIVKILEEISGKKNLLKCVKDYKKDEIMYNNYNIGKARKHLNWSPKYTLTKGLKETYDYYLKEDNKIGD